MTRICLPVRHEEDELIRSMHAAGARDTAIAAELGRPRSVIHRARKRLGLAPLYAAGRPATGEARS